MGYTHYWYREKEIDKGVFQKIVDDFKKLLPEFQKMGLKLAGGSGEGDPVITYEKVVFNGSSHCGHTGNPNLMIPWPSPKATGVANDGEDVKSGTWFAGDTLNARQCNGDCSYETFCFERVFTDCYKGQKPDRESGMWFAFCKTAFRPYDFVVNCFLIIAKHHMGKLLIVASDGQEELWADTKVCVHYFLNYGAGNLFQRVKSL